MSQRLKSSLVLRISIVVLILQQEHFAASTIQNEATNATACTAAVFGIDQLLTAILSSLDSRQDLARAEQVCRHWRGLIHDDSIWQHSALVPALELHLKNKQIDVLRQVSAKLPTLKLLVLDVDLGEKMSRDAVVDLVARLKQLRSFMLRDRSYYLCVDYMISKEMRESFYNGFARLADHGSLEHFSGTSVLTPEVIIELVEKCPRLGFVEGSVPGFHVIENYDRLLHGLVRVLDRRWKKFGDSAVVLHIHITNMYYSQTLKTRAKVLGVQHPLLHFCGTQPDPVAEELGFSIKGKWL